MHEPTPLEALHAEYARLEGQKPLALTGDQRQSVAFYVAELAQIGAPRSEAGELREPAKWIHNLLALERFVAREGRMPRENRRLPAGMISTEERDQTSWVRSQRRMFKLGRLCSYQQRRALCVPGFSFRPLEDSWSANLGAYREFTDAHRDAPKVRSKDQLERALARWAAKARLRYRAGGLPQPRVDALNELDFWSWGSS
jgi:predicted alpha/beta hydrolase